MDSLITNLK